MLSRYYIDYINCTSLKVTFVYYVYLAFLPPDSFSCERIITHHLVMPVNSIYKLVVVNSIDSDQRVSLVVGIVSF